ncbi:DNA polymerase III subunit gamma/tau [Adhaeretor mobilis]|uniref:DNA polymerase III subunit gamma/tau n=1 Tax=Adhaeretor mobilis TaxID=1930276 RepID=A0A517MS68_9BACT|nr:DNA polymerase III subunit gamma/tau [Adhaeretor mobilis]QDS97725.1 DNA polymerase III subunit tau [Adhaeretor mobilis]
MSDSPTTADSAAAAQATSGDYVVVARRYRPQAFEELIGQQHVAKALTGAIASDRVGHAYLFTGARGVGKTSAARILAKALNCVDGPAEAPCNQCEICTSVSSGDDVDVLEIDGASNRGIDEIRQLRQNVAVRPSRARFKIYIIDEVHMLTKEAFNALLKTLEEPPEHVKFIFATTEPNKIPITILSRCQRYDFAGIETASIQNRLAQIAAAEGVEVEADALQILAMRAAGSMRDSQSLLEQLLSTGSRQITTTDVTELLGIAPAARLSRLVEPLVARDASTALTELDAAVDEGAEVGQLIDQLLGYFRDCMTQAVGCDESQLLYALPGQREEIRGVADQLGVQTLLAIAQVLDQTAARLRVSTQTRTLAEMAIVRICHLENLDELAALAARVAAGGSIDVQVSSSQSNQAPSSSKKNGVSTLARPVATTPTATKPAAGEVPTNNGVAPDQRPPSTGGVQPEPAIAAPSASVAATVAEVRPEEIIPEVATAPPEENQATQAKVTAAADSSQATQLDPASVEALWAETLAAIPGMAADSASFANRITLDSQGRIEASFPEQHAFHRDACERPANRNRIVESLTQAAGRPVKLTFATHDDPNAVAQPTESKVERRRREQSDAAAEPFVQKAMELFEGDPGRVRYVPPKGDA